MAATTTIKVGQSFSDAVRGSSRNTSIMGNTKASNPMGTRSNPIYTQPINENKKTATDKEIGNLTKATKDQTKVMRERLRLERQRHAQEIEWRKLQERSRRQWRDVKTSAREVGKEASSAFPVLKFFSRLFGPLGALFKGIWAAGKLLVGGFKLIWTWGKKLVLGVKSAILGIKTFALNLKRVKQNSDAFYRLARMQNKGLTVGGKTVSRGGINALGAAHGWRNILGVATSGSKNAAAIRLAGMPGASTSAKMLGTAAKAVKIAPWIGTAVSAGADLFSAYRTQQQINKYGGQLSEKENIMLKNERNKSIGGAAGAGIGAAIGTFIAPGVGTAVGAMIGKGFGDWFGKNFRKISVYAKAGLDWAWENSPLVKLYRWIVYDKDERAQLEKEYEDRKKKRQEELDKERDALKADQKEKDDLTTKLEEWGLSKNEYYHRGVAGAADWGEKITEGQIGRQHFVTRYKTGDTWSSDHGAVVTGAKLEQKGGRYDSGGKVRDEYKETAKKKKEEAERVKPFSPLVFNTNFTPATREAAMEKAVMEQKNALGEMYKEGKISELDYINAVMFNRTSKEMAQTQVLNMYGFSAEAYGNSTANNMTPRGG